MNGVAFTFGKLGQLMLVDTINTAIAAHPEIAASVLQDLEDSVIEQAIANSVVSEVAVLKPSQTAVIGSNPKNTVSIFIQGTNAAAREAVRFPPALKLAAV